MAKKVNARIAQKHDSSQNWALATGFVPEKGEFFLVDDYDLPLVIGDGETSANELYKTPMMDIIKDSEIDSLFDIVFYINGSPYSAFSGMNWYNWCQNNPQYSYTCKSLETLIVNSIGYYVLDNNNDLVYGFDIIKKGVNYKLLK